MEYKLLIDGQWGGSGTPLEVKNKYSGQTIGAVATATKEDLNRAIEAAERAKDTMADMPAHKRADILHRAAALIRERMDDLAKTVAAEAGKALKFARAEVDRAASVFTIAAEEAKRLHGETIPLDAVPSGEGYFGFWMRRPVGVIAAISPFNFPLNLVAHKVAPAIASGNTLTLKPASTTPIAAVKLCQILEEAGMPAGTINLVVGGGGTVGEWLITDERVDKITFTGSPEIGRHILAVAGIKKVTLELGNNSPVVVAPDADLDFVAKRCALGAFYNSGQVCISVQRIYSQKQVFEPFSEKFVKATEAMVVGDPLDERVDVGPMIDSKEVDRIENWVNEAQGSGAKVLTGAKREGTVYYPTVLSNVEEDMKVVAEETFGPVASVISSDDFESALAQANASKFGLQVGVFTKDIDRMLKAVKRLNFGGVIVNDTPNFRADHMPYGGNRQSGLGREGVKFAMEDMTNIQLVAIRTDS
ncbi:MAG: aldehyde dehydrogenase family protein [Chloroflexi bacterium CFX1]|nr:Succinate-semialdehyde dehydrogenase [NADP(+)] GabD [Anaerolineales bacterium]MCE7920218.1 aldehyde dehydrogenase family protein [Chloroflexi bacterium CFX1]MCQ3952900.1 aldehyde dehydrogenase [Chloroflexota bacterium]MDL1918248.1 aldehyde dehydrogenase family protein [Chloroflexi bacterium CFX5]MCK6566752.1 aldehyde dehydrogenase family protein [Anaerolineales bacterium]